MIVREEETLRKTAVLQIVCEAFFTSAFVLSTIDFELVTTDSFVGNTDVFVANAEPDTANASDVNVKSDFKDFIKTPVLLLMGSTSEPVC